jgi:RNA polymerase sigma-70 factor, ECF subfamily
MSDLAQSWPWGRDEAELVTELQAGSDAAFDWLVTYYHAGVYNLVYGILGDAADAADVTQEVFLRAFRGIRGFRGGSSLKTWLYRISVRQALNHRRWCWRHHRQQVSIDAEDERGGATLELKDEDATPFDRLASQEMQATVRRALAEVPALFRSAVILRDLEGLAYEEIAEVMDTSIGTVKSRILRGRRMLKEILEPVLSAPATETSPSGAKARERKSSDMSDLKVRPTKIAEASGMSEPFGEQPQDRLKVRPTKMAEDSAQVGFSPAPVAARIGARANWAAQPFGSRATALAAQGKGGRR